jgi:hypothetical protein
MAFTSAEVVLRRRSISALSLVSWAPAWLAKATAAPATANRCRKRRGRRAG